MIRSMHLATPMLLLAASGAASQTSVARDSAGIAIVTSTQPIWRDGQGFRLGSTPEVVVGPGSGPEYELHRVAGTARLANGQIVVADGSSLQLRFYDARGAFLKAVGRRGRGPGEFERMRSLTQLRGDTLVVIGDLGKAEYFSGDGTALWSVHAQQPARGEGPVQLKLLVAGFSDGSTVSVAFGNPAPRERGARWIHTAPFSVGARRDGKRVELGELPVGVFAMDQQPTPPWFSPPLSIASNDDWFFVGLGTEYSIRVYRRDGRLTRIIRRHWTPRRVTSTDIDTYVTEWGKRWIKETGTAAAQRRADLRDDPYHAVVPAFSQFLADRAGRLWVRSPNLVDAPGAGQLNTLPLAPSVWSVFDTEGRWLGEVTMPARFTPFDIGERFVVGVAVDADGIETVVQYALRTGMSGGSPGAADHASPLPRR